jgi:hypothetical protein
VTFLVVAFLVVAFFAVAFFAVAFFAVAFFAVAFFAGTVRSPLTVARLVWLITSFKDAPGRGSSKTRSGLTRAVMRQVVTLDADIIGRAEARTPAPPEEVRAEEEP